ncbi:MAG: HEPN domain-containing protein [Anaerovibrio sp.]|uniref:HEPN domain-containing protein n=1 Tax=Anaerovibrio sp. TaxID=1872532 RepID=UPI0025B82A69|nr:HEPN domain-containing protein [Anaerovibrio sp.]MBE6098974.1 HEPN domain-containing protein [Anaerovibrio sp.]
MDELVKYRLESAKEKLDSAKILLDNEKYKDSIGRSYYAIFTAVRAVLARDSVDFAKHAGVISYFQREYIKTGIFDRKYSTYLQEAFQVRNNCDYDDFYVVAKSDAEEQYARAVEYYGIIKEYLLR